jgi:hypothetical protein
VAASKEVLLVQRSEETDDNVAEGPRSLVASST